MSTGIFFRNCRYKVIDLSAAREFYSKSFGVKPYFDEPTWVVFQIHDYQLWLEPNDLEAESVFEATNTFYNNKELKKRKIKTKNILLSFEKGTTKYGSL